MKWDLFKQTVKNWFIILVMFIMVGCGGISLWKGRHNFSTLSTNGGLASLTIRVIWPQATSSTRGRLIPSTAQSIVVRLLQTDYNGMREK